MTNLDLLLQLSLLPMNVQTQMCLATAGMVCVASQELIPCVVARHGNWSYLAQTIFFDTNQVNKIKFPVVEVWKNASTSLKK